MKQSQAPIWKKKRKRKFKHSKRTKHAPQVKKTQLVEQKQEVPVQQEQKEHKEHKPKNSSFLSWFNKRKKESKSAHHKNRKGAVGHFLRDHDHDIQLILFPLILLVILVILNIFNNRLFHSLSQQNPVTDDQLTKLNPYPYVEAISEPDISAQSAIVMDRDSQVILYSKNPQLRFSMASTTKIMTSLIALNHYQPDDILTVKRSYVPGSGLNFYAGEQFTFTNLMYAMLLPSANDAAQAIADNYPGGSDAFVEQMNEKAQSLHLTNTHYSDPVGLDDDGDYSTVVDMARLASYAITNPVFAEITSTKYKTISNLNFTKEYPLTNTNDLLGIDGVTGIKTGTTEGAGQVLVTSVVHDNHTYIIVVMESSDRFGDTSTLLNFINQNVKYVVPPAMNF